MADPREAPLLDATDLHKIYGAAPLFAGVDFHLTPGARVGLIGDNGTGKSTFLKALDGTLPLDGGSVRRRTGVRVARLVQAPDFGDATVADVLAEPLAAQRAAIAAYARGSAGPNAEALQADVERLGGWTWEHRLARAAGELRLGDVQRRCTGLSGGYHKRVALAQLLLTEADVLLLDEPTNHLDVETIAWLEGYLQAIGKAVVVVTHDRTFLDNVATHMAELRGGKLRSYVGNYSDYLVARAEEEALDARTEHRQRRHLAHELAWARKSPQARTTKSRARLDRIEAAAAHLAGQAPPAAVAAMGLAKAPRLGGEILTLDGVTVGHAPTAPLITPLTLRLAPGERWGIVGPNGVGKTSLLRLVAGQQAPLAGRRVCGKQTQLAYFDQHRTLVDDAVDVGRTLVPEGGDQVVLGGQVVHVSQLLARFGFAADVLRRRVATLSGGEKNRLALAKFFLQPVNLLLLDEPTNDLDLSTLAVLEQALVDFAGCAIVVSHDRAFLQRVCTGIVGLTPGAAGAPARTAVVQGDYDFYRTYAKQQARAEAQGDVGDNSRAQAGAGAAAGPAGADAAATGRRGRDKPRRPPKLTLPEQKELAGLEAAIEAAETTLAAVEAALSDPTLWQGDGQRGQAQSEAAEAQKRAVEALYARWQALLEKEAASKAD